MKNTLTMRSAAEVAVVAVALAIAALPAFASAALYAYVNQAGEVSTVEAATWQAAIATAPQIDEHSGVILLSNPNDSIVDEDVTVR